MALYSPEIQHLLYEDENGVTVGLDEVQLLDPIPAARFASVRALLQSSDLFLVYQAALVLTAWGDPAGLAQVEALVDTRADTHCEFAPHRIYGYDNVYDVLAEAVFLYGYSSAGQEEDRRRVFRKLLALYGPCWFESRLKSALLRLDFAQSLAPEMYAALERAEHLGRFYLASQILPPLACWEGEAVRPLLDRFAALPASAEFAPDVSANVAEALTLIARLPELGKSQAGSRKL